MEAQASGAIVAGYGTGTIPEVAGGAAVLVEEGETAALAQRLLVVLEDEDEYRDRRRAGLALAAERTWTRVAEQQAAFYERVLAGQWNEAEPLPSATARRELARAEFGPTAPTPAGRRPFALPLLRTGGRSAMFLGAVIDSLAERRAR